MPAIAVVLALIVGIGAVVRRVDQADEVAPVRPPPIVEPAADTVLLVHYSPVYGNDFIALAGRENDRGSVLMIPGATQLDVPSSGVGVLSQVPIDDAGARLTNSVENLLGVNVGQTVVLDDAGLTAVLGPAAPLPITLIAPVELVDRTENYAAGTQEVSAAQASELLTGQQSINELDRLVTASAVVGGWLDRLEDPGIAAATLALAANLGALIAAADAPNHRLDTLPVDSIATGGSERFATRDDEVADYTKRAFPAARLGSGRGRPRVEILNGVGLLGVAQAVADKVVPAGGKVTLTNNLAGFGAKETQVVYYQDEWRSEAQRLLDAMGCGSLRKAGKDLLIADVTILVGSDCPAFAAPGGTP